MLAKFAFCFLAVLLCVVIPTSAQTRRSSRNIANRQKIVLVGTTWKIYQTINGTEEWGTYTFLADGKIAEDEQTRWQLVGNKLNIKEQYGDIDLVVNGDKMKGSGQLGMNPRPFPMMGTKIKDSSFMPGTNLPPTTVASDFLSQLDNVKVRALTLGKLTVVDGYALQNWRTEHMGGQALLTFSSSSGTWMLMSMGGGAWDADSLAAEGVPRAVAALLVKRSLERRHKGPD